MVRTLLLYWNVSRLDSPYWGVRQRAAAALARLRDPRAIPPLRFRIGDPEPEAAVEIEKTLRHLGLSKAEIIELYLEFLNHGVEKESFDNTIEGLRRLSATSDQMVEAFSRALTKTRSIIVLWSAIEALGRSGNKKAAEFLAAVEPSLASDPLTQPLVREALTRLGWAEHQAIGETEAI